VKGLNLKQQAGHALPVRTAHTSVLNCVQLQYTTQHRTVVIISLLSSRQQSSVYSRGGVHAVTIY